MEDLESSSGQTATETPAAESVTDESSGQQAPPAETPAAETQPPADVASEPAPGAADEPPAQEVAADGDPAPQDPALLGEFSAQPTEPAQAQAAEPVKVGSVDVSTADLQRQLDAIEKQEQVVGVLAEDWEAKKSAAATAKKNHDEAVEKLREIIRRHRTPLPLFDKAAISSGSTAADPVANEMPASIAAVDAPADDAWRSVLIADLTPALKAGKLKALANNTPPVTTMGEMADWQEAKGDFWSRDIKGFGDTGVVQYAAAADVFWEARRKAAAAAQPEQAEAASTAALKWESREPEDGTGFWAANTAGIELEADILAEFVIEPTGDQFDVAASDSILMPDECPGTFASMHLAREWCEARNAELLASTANEAAPVDASTDADDFDDDLGKPECVARIEKMLTIDVAQWGSGPWSSCFFVHVGSNTHSTKLEGRHPTRAAAVTVAADGVHEWIRKLSLTGKAKKAADAIVAELDKLDKGQATEEGSAAQDNAEAMRETVEV